MVCKRRINSHVDQFAPFEMTRPGVPAKRLGTTFEASYSIRGLFHYVVSVTLPDPS